MKGCVMVCRSFRFLILFAGVSLLLAGGDHQLATPPEGLDSAGAVAKDALRSRYGDDEAARIDQGVEQVRRFWRPEDELGPRRIQTKPCLGWMSISRARGSSTNGGEASRRGGVGAGLTAAQ